jgi:hypothetical protein
MLLHLRIFNTNIPNRMKNGKKVIHRRRSAVQKPLPGTHSSVRGEHSRLSAISYLIVLDENDQPPPPFGGKNDQS